MTHGADDQRYAKLTSMLHWKQDTDALTVADLETIFNSVCEPRGHSANPARKIIELIDTEAAAAGTEAGTLKLENKITLAIGIRLAAEKFVIRAINDDVWVASIAKRQTGKLIGRYRESLNQNDEALAVLDRVELMTPENIHVNAFMYEPLVDMGDHHLRKLYVDVKALS